MHCVQRNDGTCGYCDGTLLDFAQGVEYLECLIAKYPRYLEISGDAEGREEIYKEIWEFSKH